MIFILLGRLNMTPIQIIASAVTVTVFLIINYYTAKKRKKKL